MLTFHGCSFSWANNWPTAKHKNTTMTFISPVAAKINACGPRAHQHAKSWHLRCVFHASFLGQQIGGGGHASSIEDRIDLRSQLLVCAKTNCSCGMHLDELKKKDRKMQLRKASFHHNQKLSMRNHTETRGQGGI